jgi:hypothetical protein
MVLGIELEDPLEGVGCVAVATLVEAQSAENDVACRVLGVAIEAPAQDLIGLGKATGPSIGIGEMGKDESVRVGCMKQLKPADLVSGG